MKGVPQPRRRSPRCHWAEVLQYSLQLSGTTVTVTIGSATKTFTMDKSFDGESFYFKAGNYDQSAVQGTPGTTASTIVKFYALSIKH